MHMSLIASLMPGTPIYANQLDKLAAGLLHTVDVVYKPPASVNVTRLSLPVCICLCLKSPSRCLLQSASHTLWLSHAL